jgi:hypothetical protein
LLPDSSLPLGAAEENRGDSERGMNLRGRDAAVPFGAASGEQPAVQESFCVGEVLSRG